MGLDSLDFCSKHKSIINQGFLKVADHKNHEHNIKCISRTKLMIHKEQTIHRNNRDSAIILIS